MTDEYVDWEAFIDLTEDDVKAICKKIGPTKKICRLICQVYNIMDALQYNVHVDKGNNSTISDTTSYSQRCFANSTTLFTFTS